MSADDNQIVDFTTTAIDRPVLRRLNAKRDELEEPNNSAVIEELLDLHDAICEEGESTDEVRRRLLSR